jgi:prepilin-type N-terminal cleavage/methylation domain-containing protein
MKKFIYLQKNKGFIRTPSLVSGFTLLETLVAIAILSLAIGAAFGVVSNSIQNSTIAKDQITAFFLAQEGMEFIKNIRDQNALHNINIEPATVSWLSHFGGTSGDPDCFGKACMIDSPLAGVTVCTGGFGTCSNLKQDPVTGVYGYTAAWPDSNFKREIQFTTVSSDEVKVAIKMTWLTRGQTKTFTVTESLFNRQ